VLYNNKVETEAALQMAVERLACVRAEIAKIIVGQDDVVEGVLICLLASGHVLLEGVPGLGKTTLLLSLIHIFLPLCDENSWRAANPGRSRLSRRPEPAESRLRAGLPALHGQFSTVPRRVTTVYSGSKAFHDTVDRGAAHVLAR